MNESCVRWACVLVIPVQAHVLIPSVEGCRRSGGVVSPAGRVPVLIDNYQLSIAKNPRRARHLIFDI
ncbi:MAG: hypothetical protein LBM98_11380 [Oscillospiraceae bacterium]|nr:hypothetical protein [Oscillospiraceae bacterium]